MNSRTSYYQLVYRGTSHDLPDGDTVLGRIGDFVIDDPSVDKNHARISIKGSFAEMVDLASERGTHFNGEALKPNKKVLVKQSGKIILGNVGVDLLFAEKDQWAPIATTRAAKKVLLWTSSVVAELSLLLAFLFLSQHRLPEGHIIVRQVVIVVVLLVVAGCIRAVKTSSSFSPEGKVNLEERAGAGVNDAKRTLPSLTPVFVRSHNWPSFGGRANSG